MNMKKTVIAAAVAVSMLAAQAAFSLSELGTAVVNKQADVVRTLIRQNVDVNAVETDGSTALHWAVYNEDANIVKRLIDAGADVAAGNREGMTPLALAAIAGNAEITRMLLDAGAGVNQTLANGETPLMMAARTGNTDTIQVILDRGANINATEKLRGTTALMWAAAYKNPDAVKLLLANGADIAMNSGTTAPGRNPYLAPTARERIRGFYLNTGQGGASLDASAKDLAADGSPIVALTREELVKRLPKELVEDFNREAETSGADGRVQPPPRKQWGGLTALQFAVREGDLASVKALVEAGADVNQVSEFGWTALLVATQNRYYQMGKYLLEKGANPNISNEGGWNPLYIATDNRNIEGGDYPTRKPDMDHLDYIRLLLAAGADPNIRMESSTETRTIFTHQWLREEGATPFLRAAQSSDLTLMKLLLEHGADPNIYTRDGVTPLMVASGIGWVEGVTYEWSEEANKQALQLLLDLGADVNVHDLEDGRTALMGAAHKGRNYAVQMLVDAGADLAAHDIGSRDTLHRLAGVTWQAIDYADGLVRIGVQSAEAHPETAALIRKLMLARGMEVPPEGRTLESICIVDVCK
ncbi:MAG: ankyrin repeat domain-containing protein [Pseudomonadales bacterium]|nr:ankyrin repeat domain-containing protein [Pseudomonadales bacterium]